MKIQQGFILWYDELSDDGILMCFDGNEYYFNSWSFEKTHYLATGKSKKTGKTITVNTGRNFPGLFVDRKTIKDPKCFELKNATPIEFKQASGLTERWAVDIKIIPQLKKEVLSYRLAGILDSMEIVKTEALFKRKIWMPYYERRLEETLIEMHLLS